MKFLKRISLPSSQKHIESNTIYIDVRSREEFDAGSLKGSMNIPLENIPKSLNIIPKDRKVVLLCASGMRSGRARSLLVDFGFKNVQNGGSYLDYI